MILCALKTIILEESSGTITVHEGDFFRTSSTDVVMQGYARRLTKEEAQIILSEYVRYADKIFNKPHRVFTQSPRKKIGIQGCQEKLPF